MSAADCDVLIVGAGPSGLAAAHSLAAQRIGRVVVLDRESRPGGVPRHCHHTGFGWFDLRRVLSGPDYADRRVALAAGSGAEILAETTALDFTGPTAILASGPGGVRTITARAILLATGCRERPRSARLVPGTRPHGVFTTGSLQQLVYLKKQRAGNRAVVVGAEHVSFSAVHTLIASKTEVAAMVSELPRHQTYPLFRWYAASRFGVPILAGARVREIFGKRRVEAVSIAVGDREERIACDTIVFTGGWIPDHELARLGGIAIDPMTLGPRVDAALRTSRPGVFAAGNLIRGAAIADIAALEGRAAASSIARYLRDGAWPEDKERISVLAEAPLAWVAPSALTFGPEGVLSPPRGKLVFQTLEFRDRATIEVRQKGSVLHRHLISRLIPNRSMDLGTGWLERIERSQQNPVTIYLK